MAESVDSLWVAIVFLSTPFGLSLSKPCSSPLTWAEEGQPFDKLRANGWWGNGSLITVSGQSGFPAQICRQGPSASLHGGFNAAVARYGTGMSETASMTPPPFRVPADPQSARFAFSVHATDGKARTGEIAMKRGVIRTPAFMPVGTAATVKAMRPAEVRAAGADIILGNTYHLMLRPGAERVAALGGLHAFSGWERPILTDSGGYQVMSLSALTKVTEDGVAFASHIDGSRHMLSPERSMEIQRLLGSDIVMCFDELVPTTTTRDAQAQAMERSMRWAARSRAEIGRASCRERV